MRWITLCFYLFIFSSVYGVDYYWVEGSGNWSELSHWATTSGGTLKHGQVPTSEDNVIFDENSFSADNQIVTLNNELVFFASMDWTDVDHNVILVGAENVTLNCFGSLLLTTNVDFQFAGDITFNGNPQNASIDFAGNEVGRDVYFDGEGSWVLMSDVVCRILYHRSGTLTTNDQTLTLDFLRVEDDFEKTLDIRGSELIIDSFYYYFRYPDFTGSDIHSVEIKLDNLTLQSEGSKITLTDSLSSIGFFGNSTAQFDTIHFTNPNGLKVIRPQLEWQDMFDFVSINYLKLESNTDLLAGLDVGTLDLAGFQLYRFLSGENYTMDNLISPTGCQGNLSIQATEKDQAAIFQSDNNIMISYANIRDIHAPDGNFSAENSSDLGNNDGWNFVPSGPVDYYWVGGSGDWLDPTHWSLSSGGPSSGCVPLAKDNAVFDANSFNGTGQEVRVEGVDVFINDMMWQGVTGSPDLVGESRVSAIHIGGSLRLDENMDHSFRGIYFFESSEAGNTIEVNGHEFNWDVHFSGVNGEWTFIDDIYVYREMNHNSGRIITAGNTLDFWQYLSSTEESRVFDITDSYITTHDFINDQNRSEAQPRMVMNPNTNYTLISDNSTIEFKSIFFAGLFNNGPNQLVFNNVIFSSYGGRINGSNFIEPDQSISVFDTLIFKMRGSFWSEIEANYIELSPGYDYEFSADIVVHADYLNANGTCEDGHINLLPIFIDHDDQVTIDIKAPTTFDRLMLTNIENESTPLTANNSVDNGGNVNWTINEEASRTLYWVGSTGEWDDPDNWSLMSGGIGGECVPTQLDDVVFDENSFVGTNNGVYISNNRVGYCRNFTWQNVPENQTIGNYDDPSTGNRYRFDNLHFYGSVVLSPTIDIVGRWYAYGMGESTFTSNGGEMLDLFKFGTGKLTFVDNVKGRSIRHYNGHIELPDIKMELFSSYETSPNSTNISANFNNSEIHFTSTFRNVLFLDRALEYDFDPGQSTIYFHGENARFINQYGRNYHRIISTDPGSHMSIQDFTNSRSSNHSFLRSQVQYVNLAGDGTFYGEIEMDTLIGAPGKTYTMESERTFIINEYLQLRGNNCTPIALRATTNGSKATFQMPPESHIVADFIEMRDNRGIGGAEFIAGARSTDINMSNEGWIFEDPPEFVEIGFLGPDRALCNNMPIELSAFNYSPSETYTWDDGSDDTTRVVNRSGTYYVEVVFQNGCDISDTINILESQDFRVDLGRDTTICEGSSITLDANVGIQNASYQWDDNEDIPTRQIEESGIYAVEATFEECSDRDSIEILVQEIPRFELGMDTTLCTNDIITLNASSPTAGQYAWQDGSSNASIEVSSPGLYWAEAMAGDCNYRDSILIEYVDASSLALGNDTTICAGTSIRIDGTLSGSNVVYNWADGSTDPIRDLTEEGIYVLEANVESCTTIDSIVLTVQEIPVINLGSDTTLCAEEILDLDASTPIAEDYTWQNGSSDSLLQVMTPGIYWVETSAGPCSYRDSILIDYIEDFDIDIGNDTTLCEGDVLTITPEGGADIQYRLNGSDNFQNVFDIVNSGTVIIEGVKQGCISEDSINVSFVERPDFTMSDSLFACEGDLINIEADIGALNYSWNTGQEDRIIEVDEGGVYIVTAEFDLCTIEDSTIVEFFAYPELDLGPTNVSICEGETITLQAGSPGEWQDGSISSQFEAEAAGWYRVTVVNRVCAVSDSVLLDLIPSPNIDLGQDVNICEGELVTLSVPIDLDTFIWEDGSMERERIVDNSSIYWLEAVKNGCIERDSIEVIFTPLPVLELGRDTVVCDDVDFYLRPLVAEGNILWQDSIMGEEFLVSDPGEIFATAVLNNCETSDSIFVDFTTCVNFDAYFPNIFSPNGDGNNDSFSPEFPEGVDILDYKLAIYDRWGSKVFESSDQEEEWDGKMNSSPLSSGVYIYVMEVEFMDDYRQDNAVISGDVTIVK